MTAPQWCVEITFRMPFDVLTGDGQLVKLGKGNKLVIPFDTQDAAEGALADVRIGAYRRTGSGTYHPLIDGEVVGDGAFVAGIIEP